MSQSLNFCTVFRGLFRLEWRESKYDRFKFRRSPSASGNVWGKKVRAGFRFYKGESAGCSLSMILSPPARFVSSSLAFELKIDFRSVTF
jgi:hypothetical protein